MGRFLPIVGALAVAGCSAAGHVDPSCVPGVTRVCTCVGAGKGTAVCQPSGFAWGPCHGCGPAPDGPADLAGTLWDGSKDELDLRVADARPPDGPITKPDAPGKPDTLKGKPDQPGKPDLPRPDTPAGPDKPPYKPDVPKVDSCKPESTTAFCQRLGKNCDTVSGIDNCGQPRSASCGICSGPQTCSDNVCVGPCAGAISDRLLSIGGGDTANSGGDTLSFTLKDVDVSLPLVVMTLKDGTDPAYDALLAKDVSETTKHFVVTVVNVINSAATARVCIKHK